MKMTVARILARFLNEIGVRHVFGLIGHSLFDITDALYQEPNVEFVQAQHELAASYMAASYAKGTRSLGVCMGSSGAGATNLLTGVALAYKESCPVLAIAADVDRDMSGKGTSSWHEIPQAEIFRPVTKMSVTVERPGDVVYLLKEAVRTATHGRKGPIYMGFPRDIQNEEVEVPPPPWGLPARDSSSTVDPLLIQRAVDDIAHAARPVLIAGGGVHWANCAADVMELAELMNAPVGSTPSQKGVLPEDHSLSLGVIGFGSAPYARKACADSDLILALGTTFSEGLTQGYGNRTIPVSAKIIHVNIDPREIDKIYPATTGIAGDAKRVVRELIAGLRANGFPRTGSAARVETIKGEKAAWFEDRARQNQSSDGAINQRRLYAALREAMSDDTLVVAAGGTGEALANFVVNSTVYHSGDFRAIGVGMAMAIGLKIAFPDRPVVTVSGDGSLMLEINELATAVARNLPIVVIVIHNGAYGNMKRDQIRHYNGRVIGTELMLPDLCAVAEAFGAYAARVERPSELVQAIGTALAARRPALLDVICPIEGLP